MPKYKIGDRVRLHEATFIRNYTSTDGFMLLPAMERDLCNAIVRIQNIVTNSIYTIKGNYAIKCWFVPEWMIAAKIEEEPMPSGQELKTGGVKYDESKRRMDLVPPSLINGVAEVLAVGATKYGDNNWKQGLSWSRVYAALQRHLNDFWGGQDFDKETSLCHLKHAACNIAFLIEFFETRKDLDDRNTTNDVKPF